MGKFSFDSTANFVAAEMQRNETFMLPRLRDQSGKITVSNGSASGIKRCLFARNGRAHYTDSLATTLSQKGILAMRVRLNFITSKDF